MTRDWTNAGINFGAQAGPVRLYMGAGAEIATHAPRTALTLSSQRHAADAESGVPLQRILYQYSARDQASIFMHNVPWNVHDVNGFDHPWVRVLQQDIPLNAMTYMLMDRPILLQKGTPPREELHNV